MFLESVHAQQLKIFDTCSVVVRVKTLQEVFSRFRFRDLRLEKEAQERSSKGWFDDEAEANCAGAWIRAWWAKHLRSIELRCKLISILVCHLRCAFSCAATSCLGNACAWKVVLWKEYPAIQLIIHFDSAQNAECSNDFHAPQNKSVALQSSIGLFFAPLKIHFICRCLITLSWTFSQRPIKSRAILCDQYPEPSERLTRRIPPKTTFLVISLSWNSVGPALRSHSENNKGKYRWVDHTAGQD